MMTVTKLILPVLLLGGCGYSDSREVHAAQISMIGMSANDLQACAGLPDKTAKLNPTTQIFSYQYKPANTAGFNVQLPLSLGGFSLGGSGTYCSANMRLVDNRVTEIHYTGDDDKAVGADGVCEPVVRGCMRQPEASMQAVGGAAYDRASAFSAPPVPPQPAAAQAVDAPAPAGPAAKK